MDFRIIELPPFTAVSSGVDTAFDFSETGKLGRFSAYFSAIEPLPKDRFMPRDFLFYDPVQKGLVWWWALAEGMDDGGFEHVDFEGGYYLCYNFIDHDEKTNAKLFQQAVKQLAKSDYFELDERPGHYAMGHVITPIAVAEKLGFGVMESFVPIRLKASSPNP